MKEFVRVNLYENGLLIRTWTLEGSMSNGVFADHLIGEKMYRFEVLPLSKREGEE